MGNPAFAESRIVLFPQGPVQSEDTDIFNKMLLKCGADISRFWAHPESDPNKSEVQRYVQYLQRARLGLCDELSNAIIALTKSSSPALQLIPTRRQLESTFPPLARALWVAWIDMKENPFIMNNLRQLGEVEEEVSPAPIWRDGGRAYLLLFPDCSDMDFLRIQAERVVRLNHAFLNKEAITSKRLATVSSVPPPSTEASLRRPLSWTERGHQPPRHSLRVPKPRPSASPGRIERRGDSSSYSYTSRFPDKPKSQKG
jgi:hypothetical protein